jgi:uncharacterized membrane protein YphA (DoxX/SURF4 family)
MPNRFFENIWMNRVLRILLGAVFVYASLDKLFHPLDFARIVTGYRLLPEVLVPLVAVTLPFLEFISGVLLILGRWTLPALFWIGILLLVFMAGIAQAYFRGLSIDCGCFSSSGQEKDLGLRTLVRDGLLFLCWLQAFWFYWRRARTGERQTG